MSAVTPTNPALASLLQSISNINSPLMSLPAVQSALQKASPVDIVQLSSAATQLENVDVLFGVPGSDGSSNSGTNSLFADVAASLENPAAPVTSASAANQSLSQAAENASLLDSSSTGGLPSSLLNILG